MHDRLVSDVTRGSVDIIGLASRLPLSFLALGVASSIMDILTYSRIMIPQEIYTSGWGAPASQDMGEN
ncbi:hypothetical protein RRG08_057062 [Elysia crispata]|uniref:Uncharacterized protein n=1 Tax=Elysia crispata TaxID=231223 RepID=A0AAE0Z315_9GAST|nr:hypothetical protein RRG08_057062 [Elysia crispata]